MIALPAHASTRAFRLIGRLPWLVGTVLAGMAGCGDPHLPRSFKTYEVKGTVLLANGQPLTGGVVHFESTQGVPHVADGPIRSNGSFSLSTPNVGEGAAAGEYKVWFEPAEGVGITKRAGRKVRDAQSFPFPAKYADPDTSGLKATIKPEANQLEPFRLK
jgi:hypothetical protein